MPMHKEFRRLWIEAGYPPKPHEMGSAEVCQPPAQAFLRVYHFSNVEHAISTIALARLKLARFADVNDPFELMALRIRGKIAKLAVSQFKSSFDNQMGMLCFSANWTSPVLWSHYAARHRGICLGFDLNRSLGERVKYEKDRIPATVTDVEQLPALSGELKKQLACTKFAHWEYENEVRVFIDLNTSAAEGTLHFRKFDDDLQLREVILGQSCPLSVLELRKFVTAAYPNVITFQARLAVNTFDVVPNEGTVP